MRLGRLEIVGFKSFPDKTALVFEPGISVLVGPNGCGKSNLADAILWALGEQSPKNLRSEKMEDVIFGGTETRKALGMAEVILTFSDIDGALPPPYDTHSEISVSRCLYRSGECDYFINKMPARLKDIRDLLIDSGIGYRAHNIIEQGKVDTLILASPTQMREIVEETAGIAKYRLRKAEALRKLESTEQNLARVHDIISEVRRQIHSLDRQARKAEKYERIRKELKNLDLQVAASEWRQWSDTLDRLAGDERRLQEAAAQLEAERVALEARQAEVRLHLAEKEQALAAIQNHIFQAETEIGRDEGKINTIRAQQKQWQETDARTAKEIDDIQRAQAELAMEATALQQQQEEVERDLPSLLASLQIQQQTLAERQRALSQKSAELEQQRRRLFEEMAHLSDAKNRLVRITARKQELQRYRERSFAEAAEVAQKIGVVQSGQTTLSQQRSETERRHTDVVSAQTGVTTRLSEITEALKGQNQRLEKLKDEAATLAAESASREGFYRSRLPKAQAIRSQETSPGAGPPDAVLADLIDVPAAYETAIESVLEGRLRGRIADDHAQGAPWIAALSNAQKGREAILLHHPRGAIRADRPPLPAASEEGVIGRATALISCKPGFEELVEALLGDVVLVTHFEAAARLWQKGEPFTLFVTPTGEVIDPVGSVFAGRSSEAGLLELKREIRTLSDRADALRQQIALLASQMVEGQVTQQSLQSQQTELATQARVLEIQKVTQGKDEAVLIAECSRLQKAEAVHLLEQTQWEAEAAELAETEQRETDSLSRIQTVTAEIETQMRLGQAALETARTTLSAEQTEETRLKMVAASLKDKQHHLNERQGRVTKIIAEMAGKLENQSRLRHELKEKGAWGDREIVGLTQSLTQQAALRQQQIEQRQITQQAHLELRERFGQMESQMAELRPQVNQTQQGLQEVAVARVEAELTRAKVQETIRTNYQIEIAEGPVAPQAEPAPSTEAETETPVAAVPEPLSDAAAREEVVRLRRLLDEMGPVNIGAIEEYQALSTRYQFLTTQEADLTSATESLKETITKINATTRGLFVETFHRLNEKFQTVFTTFFGGGRAELLLLEPDRPLESGVEMTVEPPGKRPRAIQLLSGGEKALTAISLLFAMFLLHPGPFCLMDEIDAPLDDENTRRFTQALTQMSDRIQFLVISHNKRTMEVARTLFGVTMEEAGVSKMIAVHLGQASPPPIEAVASA
jgi:chromosome segregation protein